MLEGGDEENVRRIIFLKKVPPLSILQLEEGPGAVHMSTRSS